MSDTKKATIRGAMAGGILLGACVLAAIVREVGHRAFPLEGNGDALMRNIHLGGLVSSGGTSIASALVIVGLCFWPWLTLTPKQRTIAFVVAGAAALVGTFLIDGLAVLLAGVALAVMYASATADLLPHDAKMGNRLGVAFGSIGGLFVASLVPALVLQAVLGGVVMAAFVGCIATLGIGNVILRVLLRQRDTAATARPG